MSKFSVLVFLISVIFGLSVKSESLHGVLLRRSDKFFVIAKDRRGLEREYSVSNSQEFIFDLMRLDGISVIVQTSPHGKGLRGGEMILVKIEEDEFNPLGLAEREL